MSIRWKLFLTLFLLTAGVTLVVLALAEREFRKWVKAEVGAQFEREVNGMLSARTERLSQARALCSDLAEQDALREVLQGERGGEDARARREQFLRLYGELRVTSGLGPEPRGTRGGARGQPRGGAPSGPGGGQEGRPAPTRGGQAPGLPVMGVISLDGELRHFGRAVMDRGRTRRKQAMARMKALSPTPVQSVAYLVLEEVQGGSGRGRVQEVVLTPVRDEDGKLLGWFFLGRDADTRVDQAFQRREETSGREGRSGLVVDGRWFVQGLEESEASQLEAVLGEGFWEAEEAQVVSVEGRTLLVAATDLNPGSPVGKGYQVALFPLDSLLEAVGRLRLGILSLGGFAVAVAALVSFLLARRFNQPIAALVAGTERVRRGELEGVVELNTRDEFGKLARAFNAMTGDLALKERYREVLTKVSDPDVAQRLVEGKLELGGEVRKAAVLFCDIRGFTAMTEGMDPTEVIALVNEHMTAMTKLVYLHGGVVDKFVGDLVMAIFGVPESTGDEAGRAAHCAVEMLAERKRLNRETGRVVEIGVGLAYGELVAGCMGSRDRLNYTVLGDRVNLASRLCSVAVAGEILVDGPVAGALDDELAVEHRDPVVLKGFSDPVEVFALIPAPR